MSEQPIKPGSQFENEIDKVGISMIKGAMPTIFQSIKSKIKKVLSGKSDKTNS